LRYFPLNHPAKPRHTIKTQTERRHFLASSFFPKTTGARGSWFYEFIRYIWSGAYRLLGWKYIGELPPGRKFVIIAAPHTSNIDFPVGFAVALHMRLRITIIAKAALFEGPFGWVMKYLGGRPLDRNSSKDLVGQIVQAFDEADEMMMVIAPEGTRSKSERWKTGFYHIALKAQVPIIFGVLDFGHKEVGVKGSLIPSGDYEADMKKIAAVYDTTIPKKEENRSDYL
jgi:1-acyl-sn-glycerol-3-phosphate acyltransferase